MIPVVMVRMYGKAGDRDIAVMVRMYGKGDDRDIAVMVRMYGKGATGTLRRWLECMERGRQGPCGDG